MTAACRFSLTIEEKGRAMWVTSADWHSVALSCPVWGATWAPQWPVATKRHLQGMACSAPQESLELFPATAESLHNLSEDLTFAHVIQIDMMSIFCIFYFYFSPYPILHSLCGATAIQMLWIALGADRVPGLIKIKEREQNTFLSSNPLL